MASKVNLRNQLYIGNDTQDRPHYKSKSGTSGPTETLISSNFVLQKAHTLQKKTCTRKVFSQGYLPVFRFRFDDAHALAVLVVMVTVECVKEIRGEQL